MHRLDQEIVGVGFSLGNFRCFSNVHRALCIPYFIRKSRENHIVFVTIEAFQNSSLKTKHFWAFMKPKQGSSAEVGLAQSYSSEPGGQAPVDAGLLALAT